jgi:hypothetical protein
MHEVASSVAEHTAQRDVSAARIRAEVIPRIFPDREFVAAARAAGNDSLLVNVGQIFLRAKLAEEDAVLAAPASSNNAYSDAAVRRRERARDLFSPDNFHFACGLLGMRAQGITDALFQSIDVEVDDVLTARQVYEWIVATFSPPPTTSRLMAGATSSASQPVDGSSESAWQSAATAHALAAAQQQHCEQQAAFACVRFLPPECVVCLNRARGEELQDT